MTPAARDRVEERILSALDEYRELTLEEAEERLEAARAAVVDRVQRRLSERGIALTEAQRAVLHECEDFSRLLGWLEQAASAATAEELFSKR